jgi:hypothetical protein
LPEVAFDLSLHHLQAPFLYSTLGEDCLVVVLDFSARNDWFRGQMMTMIEEYFPDPKIEFILALDEANAQLQVLFPHPR